MLSKPEETKPNRAVKLPTVCNLLDASKSTVWRWVREDPTFPKPFHLSAQFVVWDENEVLSWLAAKKNARRRFVAA